MTSRATRLGVIGDLWFDPNGALAGAGRIARCLSDMGAAAALAGFAPDDARGCQALAELDQASVDVSRVERGARTHLSMGDQIDVIGLFAMDAILIAVSDPRLHRFLVDLPVHLAPNARIAGMLHDLAGGVQIDVMQTVFRHDLAIGTIEDWRSIVAAGPLDDLAARIQSLMVGANLRTAAIHSGVGDGHILTRDERVNGSAGDFDQFAAAVVLAFARRDPWSRSFEAGFSP